MLFFQLEVGKSGGNGGYSLVQSWSFEGSRIFRTARLGNESHNGGLANTVALLAGLLSLQERQESSMRPLACVLLRPMVTFRFKQNVSIRPCLHCCRNHDFLPFHSLRYMLEQLLL